MINNKNQHKGYQQVSEASSIGTQSGQKSSSSYTIEESNNNNNHHHDHDHHQYRQPSVVADSGGNDQQHNNNEFNRLQKYTPLTFKWKYENCYLISYRKTSIKRFIIKFIVSSVVVIALASLLLYSYALNPAFKMIIIISMFLCLVCYFLLFFLDAGTVFQDQDENFNQERLFCTCCKIYRNFSTKHCTFCNKCVKKYDHHCSVFGKCIAKRNIFLFYAFIILMALSFVMFMVATLYQLVQDVTAGDGDKSGVIKNDVVKSV